MNSQTTKANGLGEWLSGNIVPLLSIAAVAGMSYASLAETRSKVDENQRVIMARLDAIEQRQVNNANALTCAVRTVDRLSDRAGVQAPCNMAGAIR